GRVPDAEQAALALGDDLEPDGALVECGVALLELAQRRPFRLTDRLARRLDRQIGAGGHLRPAFFLRRTRRGGCCARGAAGFGESGSRTAPLPPPSPESRGGVRDVRFCSVGSGVFGIRRRVISP